MTVFRLLLVATMVAPMAVYAQSGGGGSSGGGSAGGGASAGGSAAGAASGPTTGTSNAAGTPNAGSTGAGSAAISGVPSGPANFGGINNSLNDPSGTGNAAKSPNPPGTNSLGTANSSGSSSSTGAPARGRPASLLIGPVGRAEAGSTEPRPRGRPCAEMQRYGLKTTRSIRRSRAFARAVDQRKVHERTARPRTIDLVLGRLSGHAPKA